MTESGSLLALQIFVVSHLVLFNKLLLIDETDLCTTFGKLIIDELNQKLEDNGQNVVGKTEVAT